MQHHASYVHVVLLQLQNLHDCDDYDENDGHDDETHLRGHHTKFQIESSIEVRKKIRNALVANICILSIYKYL